MEKQIMSKKTFSVICMIKSVMTLAISAAIISCFFISINIPSGSMEPTLHAGKHYLTVPTDSDHITYDDIITFFPFLGEDESRTNVFRFYWRAYIQHKDVYIKRVIGLPGDVIEVKDGYVWRNGEKLDPDYLTVITEGTFGPYVVPENSVFCMGDNRNNSADSRFYGAFPANGVIGKVPSSWLHYWQSKDV